MFVISNDSDLFKAAAHKYIKRTGSPGHYKYWYKNASGVLVSHDDETSHNGAKREHLKRLIAGKLRGVHSMSNAEMIAQTGVDAEKFRQIKSNLTSGGRSGHMSYDDNELHEAKHSDVGSDEYARKIEGLKREIESRGETPRSRTSSPARAGRSRTAAAASPARSTPAAAASPSTPAAPTESAAAKKEREKKEKIAAGRARLASMYSTDLEAMYKPAAPAPAAAPAKPIKPLTSAQLASARRIDAEIAEEDAEGENLRGRTSATAEASAPREMDADEVHRNIRSAVDSVSRQGNGGRSGVERHEIDSSDGGFSILFHHDKDDGVMFSARDGEEDDDNPDFIGRQKVIDAVKAKMGPGYKVDAYDHEKGMFSVDVKKIATAAAPAPAATATAAQSQAREATAAARAELASPQTAALHTASPELASADAPIAKMVKDQAAGKNPYVERAKKFYDKIKGDMKEERKDSLKHFLSAIETAGHGASLSAVKAAYKTIQTAAGTGDSAWSKVTKHVESGLFHAPEELIGNPPVNVDMERMKRGFGRMQFERMKPFLGDAFKSAHPNAPAPYPTFDDLKTWDQHGSRPDWANRKKPDGTPSGNAHTTRAVHEDFHKSLPRGADGKVLNPPGWLPLHMMPVWNYVASQDAAEAYNSGSLNSNELNPETQKLTLKNQAGRFDGHLRNSLRKFVQMRGENSFADVPSYSHGEQIDQARMYKSESDAGFHRVMTNKVIPMAEFIKFMDEQSQTKKSFSLCVDEKLGAVTFKKAFTIEDDVKKSELISRIKKLKNFIGNKHD